jgi:hypothetical protein
MRWTCFWPFTMKVNHQDRGAWAVGAMTGGFAAVQMGENDQRISLNAKIGSAGADSKDGRKRGGPKEGRSYLANINLPKRLIIRKLSPAERKKVKDRSAEIIA